MEGEPATISAGNGNNMKVESTRLEDLKRFGVKIFELLIPV